MSISNWLKKHGKPRGTDDVGAGPGGRATWKGDLRRHIAQWLPAATIHSRLVDNVTLRARAHARRAREPAGASSMHIVSGDISASHQAGPIQNCGDLRNSALAIFL